jgi:hypothetical protein
MFVMQKGDCVRFVHDVKNKNSRKFLPCPVCCAIQVVDYVVEDTFNVLVSTIQKEQLQVIKSPSVLKIIVTHHSCCVDDVCDIVAFKQLSVQQQTPKKGRGVKKNTLSKI